MWYNVVSVPHQCYKNWSQKPQPMTLIGLHPASPPLLHNTVRIHCRHLRTQRSTLHLRAQADDDKGQETVVFAVVGLLSGCMAVQPAGAMQTSWQPRRHNRRMGEKLFRKPYSGQAKKEETVQKARVKKRQVGTVKSNGEKRASGPKTKEIVLTVQAPSTRAVNTYVGGTARPQFYNPPAVQKHGGLWSILLAGFLVFLLVFWKRFVGMLRFIGFTSRDDRSKKGKWIYDRSMGGRKIFVPYQNQGSSVLNPLAESTAPKEPKRVQRQRVVKPPSWWKNPPSLYVPDSVRQAAIVNARKLMQQLENSKVVGQDYSLDLVVELYKVCESGRVVASASSSNITSSIFRRGVEYAVEEAIFVGGSLRGLQPQVFVSGLATYLGIEEAMALDVVYGAIAAKSRSLILEVAADIRSKKVDSFFISSAAASFNNLSTKLRLPEDSAQVEVLTSGMKTATTPEEREEIYRYFTPLYPSNAQLLGLMLGLPASPTAEEVEF